MRKILFATFLLLSSSLYAASLEEEREELESSLIPEATDSRIITERDGITVGDLRMALLYKSAWEAEVIWRLRMEDAHERLIALYDREVQRGNALAENLLLEKEKTRLGWITATIFATTTAALLLTLILK